MVAEITRREGEEVTVSVTIRLDGAMLEAEEAIQEALNEAGMLLEQENLVRFDTDGSPIQVGPVRLTSKGQSPQVYETPYGPVQVERHVYQTAQGGKTYCPLENSARLILNATPRWAKIVSYKYASFGADSVVDDLRECNGRTLSNRYCKMLGDAVGTFAMAKEESWNYELPKFDRPVVSASVGVDGTCMLLVDDGWRVAMAMYGPRQVKEREAWLADRLHRLKHNRGAATRLWKELEEYATSYTIRSPSLREGLASAVTYFRNQKHRMNYGYHTARCQPIGSGVTEAACKVLIKERFCRSGSRWKEEGATAVLSIRALKLTPGRWQDFWRRISQCGFMPQPA